MRRIDSDRVGWPRRKGLGMSGRPRFDLDRTELPAREVRRLVRSGRGPDDLARMVLKSLHRAIDIGELVVAVRYKDDHRAGCRMLVHRHGFVRTQVFSKNADPLVLEFQM